MGYGRPAAERSAAGANYASVLMRIPAGILREKLTFVVPEPKRPTGGAFSVYEHDTWILTVAISRGAAGFRRRDLQHQCDLWPRHDGGRA